MNRMVVFIAFNRFLKDTNNLDSSLAELEAAHQKAFSDWT